MVYDVDIEDINKIKGCVWTILDELRQNDDMKCVNWKGYECMSGKSRCMTWSEIYVVCDWDMVFSGKKIPMSRCCRMCIV